MDHNNQGILYEGYEALLLKIFKLNRKQRSTFLPLDKQKVACLEKALSKLSPREEKVVRCRCGLEGGKKQTLQEVADNFGVSRERIRSIEHKSLRSLRQWINQSESRFIRDEQGNIVYYCAFFPSEAEKLIIKQQQKLEETVAKNKEMVLKLFALADKYQQAIDFIKELNTPNKNLEKISADLAKIEENLAVIESLEETIEKLGKLKSGYIKFKRDCQDVQAQLKPPAVKQSLAAPLNLKEFLTGACDLIPDAQRDIEELEFSNRTSNCLKNLGVQTLGQLVQKTELDLMRVKNFGRKSLNEVKEILEVYGLHLGMKYPEDFIEKV
ncbi:MAG: hypothetical protein NTX82_04390 [Candidatus Parcubacteria bacterium]|nr:hypothetical protein [Candidatus Parcubacteria bacterium]